MAKESVKTQWLGLWKNRDAVYSGQVIKKADIPSYSRLIVRYNKFYEKDSNKPMFVYCFANGDAANAITVKADTEDYISLSRADEILDKIDELKEIMRAGNRNGDLALMPSESQANASSLMQQAIELIEEITGEKWEFSFVTW